MPTSEPRRASLDRLREKTWRAYDALVDALDEDGHDEDCVLRCIERRCEQPHSCGVCRTDGEV